MKNILILSTSCFITLLSGLLIGNKSTNHNSNESKYSINKSLIKNNKDMKLGAFSNSLSVKDIVVSKEFYEGLGFHVLAGSLESKYLIMKNGNALIGLFQGMFEGNIMTFNPGWDELGQNTAEFDDIREIQKHLLSNGVKTDNEIDPKSTGPASITFKDPDGNMILIDQHR